MGGGMSANPHGVFRRVQRLDPGDNDNSPTPEEEGFNNYDGTSWAQVHDPNGKEDKVNGFFSFTDAKGVQHALPNEILEHVFSYIDKDEILTLAQVCTKWKTLTTTIPFWHSVMDIYKVDRDIVPERIKEHPNAWIVMKAACDGLFTKNLLINPCGEQGVWVGWQRDFVHGTAARVEIATENPPVGAQLIPDDSFFEDSQSCFVTSYIADQLRQEISFRKLKLSKALIKIMEGFVFELELMTSSRFDCGGEGSYTVVFRSKKDKYTFKKTFEMAAGEPWKKHAYNLMADHVDDMFDDPFNTTLSVIFNGKDTMFWAGHYGLKFSRFKATIKILEELHPTTEYDVAAGFARIQEI